MFANLLTEKWYLNILICTYLITGKMELAFFSVIYLFLYFLTFLWDFSMFLIECISSLNHDPFLFV